MADRNRSLKPGTRKSTHHTTGLGLHRFEPLVQQRNHLPESLFSADSLTVFAQTLCAIACINVCAHVQNPRTGSETIVWTHGNTAHTAGLGSAALVTAVTVPR